VTRLSLINVTKHAVIRPCLLTTISLSLLYVAVRCFLLIYTS
jgi:hypothetical protein